MFFWRFWYFWMLKEFFVFGIDIEIYGWCIMCFYSFCEFFVKIRWDLLVVFIDFFLGFDFKSLFMVKLFGVNRY